MNDTISKIDRYVDYVAKPGFRFLCASFVAAGIYVAPKAFEHSRQQTTLYPMETGFWRIFNRSGLHHVRETRTLVFCENPTLNLVAQNIYSVGGVPGAVIGGEVGALFAKQRVLGQIAAFSPATFFRRNRADDAETYRRLSHVLDRQNGIEAARGMARRHHQKPQP